MSPPHPVHPPHVQRQDDRTGDAVVAIVLWCLLTVLVPVLGFLTIFAAIPLAAVCATSTATSTAAVCADGSADWFWALVGYWTLLALSVVVSLVGMSVALLRGRRAWPWPTVALGFAVVLSIALVVVVLVIVS